MPLLIGTDTTFTRMGSVFANRASHYIYRDGKYPWYPRSLGFCTCFTNQPLLCHQKEEQLVQSRSWSRRKLGRLLTNRGPDRSGSCLISIWQLPDQSGSCLILPWWLPDRSGSCLILIRQRPDRSGSCLILIRQQPDRSGRCLILIRQLPDRSGSRLIFIFSDFLQSNF